MNTLSFSSITDPIYDFSMGLASGISFGLAQPISDIVHGYSTANINSQAYTAGQWTSLIARLGGVGVKVTSAGVKSIGTSTLDRLCCTNLSRLKNPLSIQV